MPCLVSYDDELPEALKSGPLHPFADFHEIEDLPRIGAGVYTTWEAEPERSERLARRPAGADTSPPAVALARQDRRRALSRDRRRPPRPP
jgi:hypothetical protein